MRGWFTQIFDLFHVQGFTIQPDVVEQSGDIAIEHRPDGWWTSFVGELGEADAYDEPYPSYNEALWAAKAAAEFGLH